MSHSENYIQATNLYKSQKYEAALKQYDIELAINSTSQLAYLGKGKTLVKLNNLKVGVEQFVKCIFYTPKEEKATYLKGINSFLLKNNLAKEADKLILDNLHCLNTNGIIGMFIRFVLESKFDFSLQLINSLSFSGAMKMAESMLQREEYSQELKSKIKKVYIQFFENKKKALAIQIQNKSNEFDLIKKSDSDYFQLYQEVKNELNAPIKSQGQIVSLINKGEELLGLLESKIVEFKKNTIVTENEEVLSFFNTESDKFNKVLQFGLKNNCIKETDQHQQIVQEIELLRSSLLGNNLNELEESVASLPKTNSRLTTYIASIEKKIEQKYLVLLKKKKYVKASKIEPFIKQEKGKKIISAKSILEKKNKKIAVYIIASLLAALFFFFLGNYFYEKSLENDAFEQAINSDTHQEYLHYLDVYPDHENSRIIKQKDFQLLYKNAVKTNSLENILLLTDLYPNSDSVKSIVIEAEDYYLSTFDGGYFSKSEHNTYLIPKGCRLKLTVNSFGKIPYTQAFMVGEEITIHPKNYNEKSLLYQDEFTTNKGWKLISEKEEGLFYSRENLIKIEDERLFLSQEHSKSNLIYTTLNFGKLTKNREFEIEVVVEKSYNNSFYLMFGSKGRAFNYLSLYRDYYKYGYCNWENSSNNQWQEKGDGKISNHYNENTFRIVHRNSNFEYYINDYLTSTSDVKWFGEKIGFAISGGEIAKVNRLRLYLFNKLPLVSFVKNKVYYCSATTMNIRKDENKNGEVLKVILMGTPLKYIGEKSKEKITARYQGDKIEEHYYKVELIDGTEGWIHGGGLCDLNTEESVSMNDFRNEVNKEKGIQKEISDEITIEEAESEKVKIDTIEQAVESIEEVKAVEIEGNKPEIKNDSKKESLETIAVKITCPKCKGKKITETACGDCTNGIVSATCQKCKGDYKNKSKVCKVCTGKGCAYCGGDGLACNKCKKGKVQSTHADCSGTGKVNKKCRKCRGKGTVLKK